MCLVLFLLFRIVLITKRFFNAYILFVIVFISVLCIHVHFHSMHAEVRGEVVEVGFLPTSVTELWLSGLLAASLTH